MQYSGLLEERKKYVSVKGFFFSKEDPKKFGIEWWHEQNPHYEQGGIFFETPRFRGALDPTPPVLDGRKGVGDCDFPEEVEIFFEAERLQSYKEETEVKILLLAYTRWYDPKERGRYDLTFNWADEAEGRKPTSAQIEEAEYRYHLEWKDYHY
jgi:hypothetical protein